MRGRDEQLVCPAGELVSLRRFGADREEAHQRILHPEGHLGVGDTELGELEQHLRLGVGDGAGVHQERGFRPGGQDHGQAGLQQPGQRSQPKPGGRDDRRCGAGGNHRCRLPTPDQLAGDGDT